MLTVRIITDAAQWDALAADWDDLLTRSATNTPFLTHEWLAAWWRWFAAPGDRLCVYAAFRDGRLCAAAPLLKRRETLAGLPVRSLRSLTNPHTPRYDWLWSPDDDDAISAILDALRVGGGWDRVRLDYVPAESPTLAALMRLNGRRGLRAEMEWCMGSPYIALNGTWDGYLSSLSRSFRKSLRRSKRAIEAIGAVRLREIRGGAELPGLLQEAYRLELATWKGTTGTAIACRPNEVSFYDEVAFAASRRGWFRLFVLELDGRMLSFDYCLEYMGTLSALKTAYDVQFRKHSPGTLATQLELEHLFERGVREFDMLGTTTEWKLHWTDSLREHRSAWVFAATACGGLAYEIDFGIKKRLERYPRLREAMKRIKNRVTPAADRAGRPAPVAWQEDRGGRQCDYD